ncbi:general secretion pathway protein G [Treponema bryantii]|uniref:General secretion pathway protein G n=1 Tax=Treponema bryantii TaxID=163 RepID=A0A1H9EXI8_9SPIR|nr:type II secretion system protein GspG [Treponema bryantii]SEQ29698.1 general secretion pathway protein G [Treponema bryantii]
MNKKTIYKNLRRFCYGFKKRSEGFTYVETVAVIAIGAVLTAGSVFSASKIISVAKKTAARNQIEQFSSALQTYFLDCGRYPTSEQGLSALWEKPVLYPIPENWDGPYLEREPCNDPWGTDYKYLSAESSIMPSEVPSKLPFILISFGPDGKEDSGAGQSTTGGTDDICSWK